MGFDSLGITVPVWVLGLLSNGLLLLGSFWIARNGLRQTRGIATFLGTAVVFWTSCTVGLEVLSPFGAISAGPMLAWAVLWFAIGVTGGSGSGPRARPRSHRERYRVGILAGVSGGARTAARGSDRSRHAIAAAGGQGCERWSESIISTSRRAIAKAGRLFLVAAPFGENAATYFPANGDLWFTWLMASWGGDRLAKVGQAPFLFLAALAAFGCARALGARRSASLVASCWFASSTPLLLYSFEPNVDTIFVAGIMMTVYFFLRALRGEDGTQALYLAAAGGGRGAGDQGCWALAFDSAGAGSDGGDDPLREEDTAEQGR